MSDDTVGKVVFGPLMEPAVHGEHDDHRGHHLPADLTFREIAILAPLGVLCVVIGFKPVWFTDSMEGAIDETLAVYPATVTDFQTVNRLHDMEQQLDELQRRYDRVMAAGASADRDDSPVEFALTTDEQKTTWEEPINDR